MNLPEMVDVTAPGCVQVQISKDGRTLWINVDGVCRLRCCRVAALEVEDGREET